MNIKLKEIVVNYIAVLLSVGTAILLLPVLIAKLSLEDLNVWFLFWTVYSLAVLLEMGLQPVSTAVISQSYEVENGVVSVNKGNISASRKLYRQLCCLQVFLFLPCSLLYFSYANISFDTETLVLWVIFFSSAVFQTYTNYMMAALKALGNVNAANIVQIISRTVFLSGSVLLLFSELGLAGLVFSQVVAVIVARVVLINIYKARTIGIRDKKSSFNLHPQQLLSRSWKIGVMHLIGLLTQRVPILLGGFFLEAGVSAQVSLLITALVSMQGIFGSVSSLYIPKVSFLFGQRKISQLRSLSFSVTLGCVLPFFFFGYLFSSYYGYLSYLNDEINPSKIKDLISPLTFLFAFEMLHIAPVTILIALGFTDFFWRAVLTLFAVLTAAFITFSQDLITYFPYLVAIAHIFINTVHWNIVLFGKYLRNSEKKS